MRCTAVGGGGALACSMAGQHDWAALPGSGMRRNCVTEAGRHALPLTLWPGPHTLCRHAYLLDWNAPSAGADSQQAAGMGVAEAHLAPGGCSALQAAQCAAY